MLIYISGLCLMFCFLVSVDREEFLYSGLSYNLTVLACSMAWPVTLCVILQKAYDSYVEYRRTR